MRARGGLVGRYVVLSLLGTGGMGAVYAAYDPDLDRKVALKLLRPDAASVDSVRPTREARALAKLAHPNVVSVFDVGTVGAEVVIAMEFIEGMTVTRWLQERVRSVREVLDLFLAAGRGLAAAHQAGLIHRDFKPDNMMVGSDGRVRVMDFGLAGAASSAAVVVDDPLASDSQGRSDLRLTREGTLLGTPAYMAPEQWQDAQVEAWTDQFSFCVALWEALYGLRPFRGRSLHALMHSVTHGEIDMVSRRKSKVPAFLRRVLERGLARAPGHRFPTMDALLAAIARGQTHQRTAGVLIGLGAVGVIIAAFIGLRTQRIALCAAHGAEIADVWNDAEKAALRDTLLATEVSYAGSTYEKAVPQIDRWTASWSEMRTQVCSEAEVDGTRTPALYELAIACLDERRDALAGLLEVLANSSATDVQLVLPAIAGLEQVAPCAERGSLERRPDPPSGPGARRQWALPAEVLVRRLGQERGLLGASLFNNLAMVHSAQSAFEEALQFNQQALIHATLKGTGTGSGRAPRAREPSSPAVMGCNGLYPAGPTLPRQRGRQA